MQVSETNQKDVGRKTKFRRFGMEFDLLKLKKLNYSSENAWDELKSGIDAAMENLDNACKKIAAGLSND